MAERTKRLLIYCSPVVLLAALSLYGKVRLDQIQGEAELLANTGREVIRLLKDYGAGLEAGDFEKIEKLYADDFKGDSGFWTEELRDERDGVRTYDWVLQPSSETVSIAAQAGRLRGAATSFELVKFKLDMLEEINPQGLKGGATAVARGVLWLRGQRGDLTFESQTTLRLNLAKNGDWKITGQELVDGTTVTGSRHGFTEVAEDVGLDFRSEHNPRFNSDWDPKMFSIIRYGPGGASTADLDGDGFEDLLLTGGRRSALYRNLGDGNFVNVTETSGLEPDLPGYSAALFVDLDADGDKDALIGHFQDGSYLYRNDSEGGTIRFTDVSEEAGFRVPGATGVATVVLSATDYDNDGDVDLYLGRYLDPRINLPDTLFYTRNSVGNALFRNNGDWTFTDVTEEAGVREGGLTLGTSWADYDEDGDQDVYIANDFGRNAFLRNNGDGTFSDVSHEVGALDLGYGMSTSVADVEGDGDLDIYVSNVRSGQRWYGQAATLHQYLWNSVRQGTIFEDLPIYRELFGYIGTDWQGVGDKMIRGNSLLLNDGTGNFTDVAVTAGLNPFGWYWGSTFLDYDNDGQLDVYANNGWISGETYDDL